MSAYVVIDIVGLIVLEFGIRIAVYILQEGCVGVLSRTQASFCTV